MKNIIYLLAVVATMSLNSCNPLEEVQDEVKKESEYKGDVALTLTDDNYKKDLKLAVTNFSTIEEAKLLVPDLLEKKYVGAGNGSSALVTFKIDAAKTSPSTPVYTVLATEYKPITKDDLGSFSRSSHITDFLKSKYATATNGTFVSINYRYTTTTPTAPSILTDGYFFNDGIWTKTTGFTLEQYKVMGEAFANFTDKTEAESKLPIALLDLFKYQPKKVGDIVATTYELFASRVTTSYVINYLFTGTAFVKYEDNITMSFGKIANKWVADNTIKYTLKTDDYTLIAQSLLTKYPNPAGNANQFKNFERRSGTNNYWSNEMIAEGLNFVLNKLNPTAEVGQKYSVTFSIYNGSAGTESLGVVKTADKWILQ